MKKHVALYNRVWEALHFDDKFVVCLDLTHDEVVVKLCKAIYSVLEKHEGHTLWMDTPSDLLGELADAVITALMCNESAPPEKIYGKEDVSGDADEAAT